MKRTARGGTLTDEYPDIKALRQEQGLNLTELAKKAGVFPSTISKMERGAVMREKTVLQVLDALTVPNKSVAEPVTEVNPETDVVLPGGVLHGHFGPEPLPVTDPLVLAFQQFLTQLREQIVADTKAAIIEHIKQFSGGVRAEFPVTPIPTYVPPPSVEEVVRPNAVLALGLPTSMRKAPDWKIEYTRRFIKELEKLGGLKGIAIQQVIKLSEAGEVFSNIGFKKMAKSELQREGINHEFRVNRRWRILLNKSNQEKSYTMLRVVHHDYIE